MERLNALTFKQLRTLEAMAATGSLTAAADGLGLTTPAVHSQLRALEQNFGCAMIFRQGPRRFTLTPEGEALLEAHRKSAAALTVALRRIEGLQRGLLGTVVLGVVSTGKYFAPRLVASLKRLFPDIDVILKIGNRIDIIVALSEAAIDLAIMGRPPRDPPVTSFPIGDHPHSLIVPLGHRLARLRDIRPDDILNETILFREPGSGTRILATRFLDRIGEGRPYDTTVLDSNETIKQAVMAGLGIAIISRHTVTEELRGRRLLEVTSLDLPIMRQWYVLHRADLHKTGAVTSILEFIKREKATLFPE
jgi:LysR family transcriptional regulator, low CO2-responsive transcriptional regulator